MGIPSSLNEDDDGEERVKASERVRGAMSGAVAEMKNQGDAQEHDDGSTPALRAAASRTTRNGVSPTNSSVDEPVDAEVEGTTRERGEMKLDTSIAGRS